ncbi:triple tyrosine motif-containing protein [Puia sp. P3]|uniref:triple tyrosine motif-containing protein n=1 Tax=Puia sp. P3 TaxID=3423952 RepID=UPI003D663F40
MAPYDDVGVIGLKGDSIVRRIGSQEGLTSDICRCLSLNGDELWVGTDKGLNRVDLRNPAAPVLEYTSADGLSSNVINVISAAGNMVYVGTPRACPFLTKKVNNIGHCRIAWLGITSGGVSRLQDSARLKLQHNRNNIRFEYAGISYRSAGNILYRYRLLGLDTGWKSTRETFLDYPTLPPGDYELQIHAVNKFGVVSPTLSQRFTVAAPLVADLVVSPRGRPGHRLGSLAAGLSEDPQTAQKTGTRKTTVQTTGGNGAYGPAGADEPAFHF